MKKEELDVAIAAAKAYPKGHGYLYLSNVRITTDASATLKHLKTHPDDVKFG